MIFLDEIGDISPATQIRLLRVPQEKFYEPLKFAAAQNYALGNKGAPIYKRNSLGPIKIPIKVLPLHLDKKADTNPRQPN